MCIRNGMESADGARREFNIGRPCTWKGRLERHSSPASSPWRTFINISIQHPPDLTRDRVDTLHINHGNHRRQKVDFLLTSVR
ncbi:Hypothetical protein NTJ_11808 [Nesidiocoris tenuis]|uniref:Uncharacterized protein n=1 Tax=Nesidiocoris tenuis TaxID=355587 RepID=A0ABN7B890_9HEMI|nr:Hypothetical protein NTJ_11808 [Nesidiocoris tenuis]